MSAAVRVLVVDDHASVRAALVDLLGAGTGTRVVGTAADGTEGAALAESLRPDVVLMDLRMPGTDGVVATEKILAGGHGTAVVVLTTNPDDPLLDAALEAGAVGWLAKDASAEEIALAIATAAERDRVVGGWFALAPLSCEWAMPWS